MTKCTIFFESLKKWQPLKESDIKTVPFGYDCIACNLYKNARTTSNKICNVTLIMKIILDIQNWDHAIIKEHFISAKKINTLLLLTLLFKHLIKGVSTEP